jgi:hypothetical protein
MRSGIEIDAVLGNFGVALITTIAPPARARQTPVPLGWFEPGLSFATIVGRLKRAEGHPGSDLIYQYESWNQI